ncbi:MAG: 7TM domain-containing protein [Candidatus Portnoybacteria bacterium]
MNIFSITQHLVSQGIPEETLVLLLMLPIVATIIVFARQVIGIKGFGIYTPTLIAFSFLVTGLKYGLILFAIILLVGTLTRLVVKKFRLLYLPRMAIILTVASIAVLASLYLNQYFSLTQFSLSSVFVVLIMIALTEKFIAVQIERGGRSAGILTSETIILSVISYWVISWSSLENLILSYPLLIIAGCIGLNILLGKWTGLRLNEYFRFREVIKHVELPGKK